MALTEPQLVIAGELLAIGLNWLMAEIHAWLILRGLVIRHFLWGLLYGLFAAWCSWRVWDFTWNGVYYFLFLGIIRILLFSPWLNYLRHLPFFYINPTGHSLTDRIEGKAYKVIYIACIPIFVAAQTYFIWAALQH